MKRHDELQQWTEREVRSAIGADPCCDDEHDEEQATGPHRWFAESLAEIATIVAMRRMSETVQWPHPDCAALRHYTTSLTVNRQAAVAARQAAWREVSSQAHAVPSDPSRSMAPSRNRPLGDRLVLSRRPTCAVRDHDQYPGHAAQPFLLGNQVPVSAVGDEAASAATVSTSNLRVLPSVTSHRAWRTAWHHGWDVGCLPCFGRGCAVLVLAVPCLVLGCGCFFVAAAWEELPPCAPFGSRPMFAAEPCLAVPPVVVTAAAEVRLVGPN